MLFMYLLFDYGITSCDYIAVSNGGWIGAVVAKQSLFPAFA
jgi:hypothetical protein